MHYVFLIILAIITGLLCISNTSFYIKCIGVLSNWDEFWWEKSDQFPSGIAEERIKGWTLILKKASLGFAIIDILICVASIVCVCVF